MGHTLDRVMIKMILLPLDVAIISAHLGGAFCLVIRENHTFVDIGLYRIFVSLVRYLKLKDLELCCGSGVWPLKDSSSSSFSSTFERDLEILKFLKILSIDHSKTTLAPLSLQQLEGVLKIFGHSVFLYALSPPPHPQFCSCCSKFCSCFKKTRKLGHRCASLACIT